MRWGIIVLEHSRVPKRFALVVSGAVVLLSAVLSFAALPWTDNFEAGSYTLGENINGKTINGATWSASSTAVEITNIVAVAGVSTQSCYIPDLEAATNALACTSNVIWTDFYVKPTLMQGGQTTEVDSAAAAMLFFSTNGYPQIQEGPTTNWVNMTLNIAGSPVSQVSEGQWVRVTVCRNYTTKLWSLFVNNELVRDNIAFINTSSSSHSKMSIKNETYLDDVLITYVRPTNAPDHAYAELTSDIDLDGMYDAWEIENFGRAFTTTADGDPDADGLSNVEEFYGGTDPNTADYYVQTIPYRADFESAALGTVSAPYWNSITNTGELVVQDGTVLEGSQALSISNGTLAVILADSGATNVWIQMYVKPVFYDDDNEASPPDDPAAEEVAAFYIRTNGVVRAWGKDNWTNLTSGYVASVPSDTWLGVAVHIDYTKDNWDLYMSSDEVSGGVMQKVNVEPLLINDAASGVTHFSNFTVSAVSKTYIDYLAVSDGYETNNASYTNMIAYDRLAGQESSTARPPYVYDGTNAILAYAVGNHLKRGLLDDDQVKVYNTNGWNTYVLNSGDWQVYGSAMPVDEIYVESGAGLAIKRGPGDDVVVFYPYGQSGISNLVVLGTNNTDALGWNLLASPFAQTRDLNNNGGLYMNLNAGSEGDRIYLGRSRPIFSWGQWKISQRAATNRIASGEAFWYYHNGTGFTWQTSE